MKQENSEIAKKVLTDRLDHEQKQLTKGLVYNDFGETY